MPRSKTGSTVGSTVGGIIGGSIGGRVGGVIGGLFGGGGHGLSSNRVTALYNQLPAWAKEVYSEEELQAAEANKNRQAGFIVDTLAPSFESKTSVKGLADYLSYSERNYKPVTVAAARKFYQKRLDIISGAANNVTQPSQAGAQTMGIIPPINQMSSLVKSVSMNWLAIGLIILAVVGIVFMLARHK